MSASRPQRTLRTMPARGSRVRRETAATAKLESAAAEFALLAQRRARLTRQLELLERQARAAGITLAQVDSRMRHLSLRMGVPTTTTTPPTAETATQPAPVAAPPGARTRGRRNLVLEY